MDLFFFEFVSKWISERRFPREELRIRPWLAVLGGVVFLTLAVALAVAAID